MKSILFHLGPLTIYSYGAVLVMAFVMALVILMKRGPKAGIEKQIIYDIGISAIVGGLFGARVAYVGFHWSEFSGNLLEIWMIHKGGLAFYGSFIGGVITLLIFLKYKKIPFLKVADVMIPAVALGHGIGRLGCLMNGCCYGKLTTCIFGITFPAGSLPAIHYGVNHIIHPTQVYESFLLVILFFVLLWIDRHKKFEGQTFVSYVLIYPAIRFCMEYFRGDNPFIVPRILTLYQGISLMIFTAGITLLIILKRKS